MSYYNYNSPQDYIPTANQPPSIPPISSLDPNQQYIPSGEDVKPQPYYRPQPPIYENQPNPLAQHQLSWQRPTHMPMDQHQYLAPPAQQFIPYQYPGIPYYPYMQHMYPRQQSSPRQHSVPVRAPMVSQPLGRPHLKQESSPAPKGGTFKPKNTKRNSKPRIHKLSGDFRAAWKKSRSPHSVGEASIDDMLRHFQDALAIDVPEPFILYLKVEDKFEAKLLDLFVNNLTKSLDIFLPCDMFRLVVPHVALLDETRMISDSIYCLASMILNRINPDSVDPSVTINYYHQCIKSIRYHLSMPGVETNESGIIARCLLSTIMLCVYELFLVAEDATYIKGAASIFSSILRKNMQAQKPSLLKSSPFYQGLFWAMILSDMVLSLKYDLPTMYPIDTFWRPLDPEYFDWFESATYPGNSDDESVMSREEEVWWIRRMIYLSCCVHDFLFQPMVLTKEETESKKCSQKWLQLNQSVNEFEASVPMAMKPIICKPASSSRRYPVIFFGTEGTAIFNLNFKLCKIALHQSLQTRLADDPVLSSQISNYTPDYTNKLAKDIIGILKTYDSDVSVWPVNVHAIRQAAKYMKDDSDDMRELGDLINKVLAVCHLQYKKS
ncbi:hypothetical protein PGUG_00036 [Meyerozyma guilliermondii ATCC 6260]|uniref:Transcription factor domain-containing protein n=1 Tax=Meyerozyma guilliermondii (strain ATCC 6260 / CBS 566 / DSM 6381 / JCM 1539 / NBRC 10279 / NRRL Y-324) TaxID=294746 RepID=A5D9T1_PICGU|nr:uncharacterized protein PGUG_00036 [Meyerozyma guilliermondii ATCC 6260]EDK35938.2 hypothetical protein PGUG_00036 [Meyerozyma guilliermondii ATCC 6260]